MKRTYTRLSNLNLDGYCLLYKRSYYWYWTRGSKYIVFGFLALILASIDLYVQFRLILG